MDAAVARSAGLAAQPELTVRAILTGILIGAALTPCNVYSGLKIGWSFNMSIAAGLLGVGFWRLTNMSSGGRRFGLLENNINQTTASSAASIISGGLVAPIPALTLLTGQTFSWPVLSFWVFAVSILGVFVAASIREQMIVREQLRFPAGLATAVTMTQIHSAGRAAADKLKMLAAGAAVSGLFKLAVDFLLTAPRLALPGSLPGMSAVKQGLSGVSLKNLSFAFDPSLLMLGFGAMIGLRAGVSLMLGAVLAWGMLAPLALSLGWAEPGDGETVWFEPLVTWLIWPGVTLTVVSTLTSFLFSVLRIKGDFKPHLWVQAVTKNKYHVSGFALIAIAITAFSFSVFGIGIFEAVLAILISFVLAIVAARVTGETGITPVGALGKVTQLSFGLVSPGNISANLMMANITGGAAGQSADLMHDLKTGAVIGATPRHQFVAQLFGILIGSLVGSLIYLLLIPNPQQMLITAEWPAPAVATWKAVAEVLSTGISGIPEGAAPAMAIAALAGIVSAFLERRNPARYVRILPSAPAFGLAFVIPAWNSISLFIGALAASCLRRWVPGWSQTKSLVLAAGLVAGESLVGVGITIYRLTGG